MAKIPPGHSPGVNFKILGGVMSVIAGVTTVHAPRRMQEEFWETVTCGDTGSPIEVPTWVSHISIQATGTFNSETLMLQGSNDGTNYADITNLNTSEFSFTAAGILGYIPRYLRPSFSGSSGGDVDVTLLMRK